MVQDSAPVAAEPQLVAPVEAARVAAAAARAAQAGLVVSAAPAEQAPSAARVARASAEAEELAGTVVAAVVAAGTVVAAAARAGLVVRASVVQAALVARGWRSARRAHFKTSALVVNAPTACAATQLARAFVIAACNCKRALPTDNAFRFQRAFHAA